MNNKPDEKETNENEPTNSIQEFKFLLDNMDEEQNLKQINQSIDNEKITEGDGFYDQINHIDKEKSCECRTHLNRCCDLTQFILIFFDVFFCLVSTVAIVLTFSFSFYSVILMSYVFFVSTIVSYAMAPIYKIMSGDALGSFLSILQVFIASPLISFFIFYITKSVKALGEFFQNTKQMIINILNMYRISFKNTLISFCSGFCECINYQILFDKYQKNEIVFYFFYDLIIFLCTTGSCYATFFIDKMLPTMGLVYYLSIVIQIFASIIPSYIYFFQTLFNIKCKKKEIYSDN